MQYFLVPDVEVENGGEDEDDDLEDEEEEDDEGNVSVDSLQSRVKAYPEKKSNV